MLTNILWVLGMGFLGGQIARRLQMPSLVGMILAGIFLGSQVTNLLTDDILQSADALRTISVILILMKAGLGLDRQKIGQQGAVALKLGFLPAICEAIVVAVCSVILLDFSWQLGLLLGCILGAESPAVIVPGMLRLKSLGWGVGKGIPDAILTGSALSDVLLLLIFNLLIILLTSSTTSTQWLFLPLQLTLQIIGGVIVGWLTGKGLVWLLIKQKFTQNAVQDTLITALSALFLVVIAHQYPFFSGYLAVMSTGFFLIEFSPPLARRLRGGFNNLWKVAEIFLFVLLGATIPLNILGKSLIVGLMIIALGTLIGRMIGWYLSTWGSNWNSKEKLFLLAGNSAKATVQAAIGAIPLSYGIKGGEEILAIAALSILVTAPLGAWAIPTFAPRLLEKGDVDPTKVSIEGNILILTAIDDSSSLIPVLKKTAEIARRSDGEVIVLHIQQENNSQDLKRLKDITSNILADIHYQFVVKEGSIPEEIVQLGEEYQVAEIIMGKDNDQWDHIWMSSVSQTVLETSPIPVMLVK
jgi:NhaP-type Na+/H+ or K+/H+ antiporter